MLADLGNSLVPFLPMMTAANAFAAAALIAIWVAVIAGSRRVTRDFREKNGVTGRYSPAWTGSDGKRWKWDMVRNREVRA